MMEVIVSQKKIKRVLKYLVLVSHLKKGVFLKKNDLGT